MKLVLVNQRYGHSRTIVIKGWLKGLLSLCLLGAPVALGMGYQLALADDSSRLVVSHEQGQGVADVDTPVCARAPKRLESADALSSSGNSSDNSPGSFSDSSPGHSSARSLGNSLTSSLGRDVVDVLYRLSLVDWQYEASGTHTVVIPHALAEVARLSEPQSFELSRDTFAHGRIIDRASYLRRTHR